MLARRPNLNRRVLSIDPRINRIGYVFFCGNALIDWGTTNLPKYARAAAAQRLLVPVVMRLLDEFEPTVLLVPAAASGEVRRSRLIVEVLERVVDEAATRGIAAYKVANEDVKMAFVGGNGHARQPEIHLAIVREFPELTLSIPQPRKLWHAERYSTPLFHAVAMYCAWRVR
jgi:hypothetical protein